jgi:hypothetical protein
MECVYLQVLAQEGAFVRCNFHSSETLVCIFCGLGNIVKDYVVISRPYTKGSVRWAKWRLLVTDG